MKRERGKRRGMEVQQKGVMGAESRKRRTNKTSKQKNKRKEEKGKKRNRGEKERRGKRKRQKKKEGATEGGREPKTEGEGRGVGKQRIIEKIPPPPFEKKLEI